MSRQQHVSISRSIPAKLQSSQSQLSQQSQSAASVSVSENTTSFTVPVIVRSPVSDSGHRATDEKVLNLQNFPQSRDGKPFLQCEIPLYLGPTTELASPESQNIHHREIKFLKVLSTKDMEQKSRNGGFSRVDKMKVLDQLFPPSELVIDKQKWRLDVSKSPADANDRINLFKKFEAETQSRHFLNKGFSPMMNALTQDLMDECIRQDILANTERGILLASIKNGLNRLALTLSALIENSQMKVGRVTTTLGGVIGQLKQELEKDQSEVDHLNSKLHDLELKMDGRRSRHHEERKHEQAKYHAELDYYRKYCASAREQVDLFENPEARKRHHEPAKKTGSTASAHHGGSLHDTASLTVLRKGTRII